MVKLVRPLFGDTARGKVKGVGVFRQSKHGPQLIGKAKPRDPKTPAQQNCRYCHKIMREAWLKKPIETFPNGSKGRYPPWGEWYRYWLPACRNGEWFPNHPTIPEPPPNHV